MDKATLSIDLDNLWAYLKVSGDPKWESYPSYLDTFVPYLLDLLDELSLKITFFIVGKDAALDQNRLVLQEIVDRGHEVANHSFHHEPWMKTYSKEEMEKEIAYAEEAIYKVTGKRPVGFRGPGFSWSPVLHEVLMQRGYKYDSSLLPTFLGPIARLYYFHTAKPSLELREKSKELYGTFREGFRPCRNHFWEYGKNKLLEMPVTTIPLLKTPFHMSYLLFLPSPLRKLYLETAIQSCRLTKTAPNFLIHPTDLMGADKVPEMAFFPGMHLPTEKKRDIFIDVVTRFQKHFEWVPMGEKAEQEIK